MKRSTKIGISVSALLLISGAGGIYYWEDLPIKDLLSKITSSDDSSGEQKNFSIPKKSNRDLAGEASNSSANKAVSTDVGDWRKEPALNGDYPKRITNLNLRSDTARSNIWQASMEFLESYGRDMYKMNPSQWKVGQLMPGRNDEDLKKIVYEQEINGIPVLNSRLAFFYSGDGSLLEVQANMVAENFDVNSGMSSAEAAAFAYIAISQHYSKAGLSVPDGLSSTNLAENAKYAVYLSDAGEAQPVYQFLVGMPGLSGQEAGEREIIVDANSRQVAIDRRLTRN